MPKDIKAFAQSRKAKLYDELTQSDLVHSVTTNQGTQYAAQQPFTVENYRRVIKLLGYRLRYNIMTGDVEVWDGGTCLGSDDADDAFEMFDDALTLLKVPISRAFNARQIVGSYDTYHPMMEWVDSAAWDGVDRLPDLAASVPTDSELWPTYLRKWLIQLIEAVFGWQEPDTARSLPHVIVFTGEQGVGKGRWMRTLMTEAFVKADAELHLGGGMHKDSMLDVLSRPGVELGEIDSTFGASAVSSLKSFLSRQVDSIRKPYARNPIIRPRMTCFMGSVNHVEFLVDNSGSRRFWPVLVRVGCKLAWDHGIDMQQVFAQVLTYWEAGEDWNLDEEQEAARIEEAKTFTDVPAIAEMAAAHWSQHHNNWGSYALLNRTHISKVIGGSMHPAQLRQLGDWLKGNLGPHRKLKGCQRVWAWPGSHEHPYSMLSEEEAKAYVKGGDGRGVNPLFLVSKKSRKKG